MVSMRSVPQNPEAPAIHFASDVAARRTAILLGGVSGAVVGGAAWAATHKHIGWLGVVLPVAGAVGGAYLWNAAGVGRRR